MPARARPESFGAHGAVPPYLREDSLAAALATGEMSGARDRADPSDKCLDLATWLCEWMFFRSSSNIC